MVFSISNPLIYSLRGLKSDKIEESDTILFYKYNEEQMAYTLEMIE